MRFSLLGLLILPLAELYLLFTLAAATSGLTALLVVIITAVAGVTVLRRQGFNNMNRMRQRMAQGQSPAPELLGGMLTGFAGLLLILPGLITDTLGVLLLIPFLRQAMTRRMMSGGIGSTVFMGGFSHTDMRSGPHQGQGNIIDGEVVDRDQPRSGEPLFPGDDRDQRPR